jgi:hypothetical protein
MHELARSLNQRGLKTQLTDNALKVEPPESVKPRFWPTTQTMLRLVSESPVKMEFDSTGNIHAVETMDSQPVKTLLAKCGLTTGRITRISGVTLHATKTIGGFDATTALTKLVIKAFLRGPGYRGGVRGQRDSARL